MAVFTETNVTPIPRWASSRTWARKTAGQSSGQCGRMTSANACALSPVTSRAVTCNGRRFCVELPTIRISPEISSMTKTLPETMTNTEIKRFIIVHDVCLVRGQRINSNIECYEAGWPTAYHPVWWNTSLRLVGNFPQKPPERRKNSSKKIGELKLSCAALDIFWNYWLNEFW